MQDVLNSAVATKGVQHTALPKLRKTVKHLQDVATREPQVTSSFYFLCYSQTVLPPKL